MLRAACLLALVAGPAIGQVGDPPPGARFTLLLRDPAGAPVVDAAVDLVVVGAGALPALAWFANRARAAATELAPLQPAARLALRSDARGLVSATVPAAAGGAASGLVTTAGGLGALVIDLHADRAQRLALAPLAAIANARGGEPLRAHALARTASGAFALPPQHGDSVRLPAGDLDVWIRTARGWQWRRLALAAGQQVTLADESPVRRVRRPGLDWQLLPDGRADVALFADGESEIALCGDAAAATFVAWQAATGRLLPPQALPPAPGGSASAWPLATAAATAVAVAGLGAAPENAPADEALALVQRTAAGDWLPLGIAVRRASEAAAVAGFLLPSPPPGDCWLVHLGASRAPCAAPYRVQAAVANAAAGSDRALAVLVRDAAGAPVADVALAYEPDGMPPAAAQGRTDDRGRAGLGLVRTPGALRVVDARFANQTLVVPAATTAAIDVVVDTGARLRGIARWPDGGPARGAVVTLRDPRGQLAPPTRTTTTADDGSFAFPGLADGGAYVVFATARRDGRTWSGRAETMAGSEAPIALVVRDEDPEFAPPRR
jgi:hypothetical protein